MGFPNISLNIKDHDLPFLDCYIVWGSERSQKMSEPLYMSIQGSSIRARDNQNGFFAQCIQLFGRFSEIISQLRQDIRMSTLFLLRRIS